MNKLTVGKGRTVKEEKHGEREDGSRIMLVAGLLAMSAVLVIPLWGNEKTEHRYGDDAVAVISTAVTEEREKLMKPDKNVSAEEEWSLYDRIGQMIADLILGDR